MALSNDMIVNRIGHVQYLTVSKSYSDECACSLPILFQKRTPI